MIPDLKWERVVFALVSTFKSRLIVQKEKKINTAGTLRGGNGTWVDEVLPIANQVTSGPLSRTPHNAALRDIGRARTWLLVVTSLTVLQNLYPYRSHHWKDWLIKSSYPWLTEFGFRSYWFLISFWLFSTSASSETLPQNNTGSVTISKLAIKCSTQ